jgi:hypothetical protein
VRNFLKTSSEEMTAFPTPDVRIVRKVASGNVARIGMLHRDGLGSIRAVTADDGLRNETDLYRPFGEQAETVQSLSAVREAKGFIGERFDANAGLLYLNARYYDPKLGMPHDATARRTSSADLASQDAQTVDGRLTKVWKWF